MRPMFDPPGTVLTLAAPSVPQEVMVASSSQQQAVEQHQQQQLQTDQQNRVIVNRRASVQLGVEQQLQQQQQQQQPTDAQYQQQQKQHKQQKKKKLSVRPSYSALRTNIIRLTPESMKCKLYCKGAKCIYCNPENWTDSQKAINGLYSHWINNDILAMARPTVRTFEEFDLIKQFKKLRIRTVLNLQCVKEHDFCGSPLIEHTGFTYDPEALMAEKVYYFNFAIPDFGTTSLKSILDICKVIWFSLKYGRIAIHCHAGLGRTGTMIACFLVWSNGMSSLHAIEAVRSARPNSIQSIDQINVVEEFEFLVQKDGTALPSIFYANNGLTLPQLMANQGQFLPSDEARRYAHIPKVLFMLCDRLLSKVFGKDGFKYMPPNGHHARSCTFGTIFVNWRNAFTPNGKKQVRQMVTAFARITAFPYEKDHALISRFQQLSLVNAEVAIDSLETVQLITVLNALLESIKRPYCSRRSLIDALSHFSPDNPTVLPPPEDESEEHSRRLNEEVELVRMLMNPVATNVEMNGLATAAMSSSFATTNSNECQMGGEEEEKGNDEDDNDDDDADDGIDEEGQIKMGEENDGRTTQQQQQGEEEPKEEGGADQDQQEVLAVEERHQQEKIGVDAELLAANANEVMRELRSEEKEEEEVGAVSAEQQQQSQHNEAELVVVTAKDCAKYYGGISLETVDKNECANVAANGEQTEKENFQSTSSLNQPSNITTDAVTAQQDQLEIAFDHHDSHANKSANLNADWQCVVFYVCNVLSFLSGENYDTLVDLLTFWFAGDNNRDVKQAVYCHMRDLFARNMRQQEQQAAEWRRRMTISATVN